MNTVIELRQYTLFRNRRDELIALFEEHFLEPQNAVGARVLGTFSDLDDPERFVWIRGFDSMVARHEALSAFYDGALWKSLRNEAVVTMRDSDNVLLLQPLDDFNPAPATAARAGLYVALIFDLRHVDPGAFAKHFRETGTAMLRSDGAEHASVFLTEPATNTFTRLPVRVDERVLVCVARFPDIATLDRGARRWKGPNALRDAVPDELLPAFMRPTEILRLQPTARSAMR